MRTLGREKHENHWHDQTEKSEEVITEKVSFWSYDFCDLMELDFEQLLKDQEQDVKYGYSCNKIDYVINSENN